jgi:hypothetical protein
MALNDIYGLQETNTGRNKEIKLNTVFAPIGGGSGGGITDILYANLVTAIGASTLVEGSLYSITDFATVHYLVDGAGTVIEDEGGPIINTGATEALIVLATSANTISHEAHSVLYPQDIIHYNWDSANWLQDFSFSTDQTNIITGFKGVIYFRHDTLLDNYIGYDFRTVKFRRWDTAQTTWNAGTTYAAGAYCTAVDGLGVFKSMKAGNLNNATTLGEWWVQVLDLSVIAYWNLKADAWLGITSGANYIDCYTFHPLGTDTYEIACRANHIEPFKDTQDMWDCCGTILSNNVFFLVSEGYYTVYSNEIGAEFYYNSVGAYFKNNSVGTYFNNNSVGTYFKNNSVGANFYNNSVGANFNSNSVGTYFNNNSVGAYFINNSVGANFNSNSVGTYFNNNSVGANVQYIITPSKGSAATGFHNNTIRDGVFGGLGTELDFTCSTHVFLDYNCEIYRRPDGAIRLTYKDDADATIVCDYNDPGCTTTTTTTTP